MILWFSWFPVFSPVSHQLIQKIDLWFWYCFFQLNSTKLNLLLYSTHRWILVFFHVEVTLIFLLHIYHNLLDAGNFHFFSDDYRHFYSMSIGCEKTRAFLLLTISVYTCILITLQILLAWHALFSASLCGDLRA